MVDAWKKTGLDDAPTRFVRVHGVGGGDGDDRRPTTGVEEINITQPTEERVHTYLDDDVDDVDEVRVNG